MIEYEYIIFLLHVAFSAGRPSTRFNDLKILRLVEFLVSQLREQLTVKGLRHAKRLELPLMVTRPGLEFDFLLVLHFVVFLKINVITD